MTDRELLEKFYAEFSDFRTTTEANFTRVFDNLIRIENYLEKRFDNMDGRIDLVHQELVGVKIQTKSRIDRMEARIEQLEQR
jgi:hypothetical protein